MKYFEITTLLSLELGKEIWQKEVEEITIHKMHDHNASLSNQGYRRVSNTLVKHYFMISIIFHHEYYFFIKEWEFQKYFYHSIPYLYDNMVKITLKYSFKQILVY